MLDRQTILRAVFLILAGVALGAANQMVNPNAPEFVGSYPDVSSEDTAKIPEAAEEDDPPYISIGEAAGLFNSPQTLFVDARDEWDFQQGHIKGAINVPFEGDPQILDDFIAATAKDQQMVVYCGGAECDLSLYLGRTLAAEGFTRVNIFFGGWSDWLKLEMPTATPEDGAQNESGSETDTGSEIKNETAEDGQ